MLCLPNMLPPDKSLVGKKNYREFWKMFLYVGDWSGKLNNFDKYNINTLLSTYLLTFKYTRLKQLATFLILVLMRGTLMFWLSRKGVEKASYDFKSIISSLCFLPRCMSRKTLTTHIWQQNFLRFYTLLEI